MGPPSSLFLPSPPPPRWANICVGFVDRLLYGEMDLTNRDWCEGEWMSWDSILYMSFVTVDGQIQGLQIAFSRVNTAVLSRELLMSGCDSIEEA